MRRVRFQHLLAFPFLVLGQAARLLGQVLLQTEGFLAFFPDDMFGSAVRQNIAGLDIVPEAGVQNGFQAARQLSVGDGVAAATDNKDASKQALLTDAIEGCYMSGVGDTSANSIGISYDAIVTPVSEAVTNTAIASVLFIIAWDAV